MKKLIRVFIAVFCLFFVLLAIPGSHLRAITPYTQKIPEYMSRATLRLAESIDSLMGSRTGPDSHETASSAQGSGREKAKTQDASGQDSVKEEKEQDSSGQDSLKKEKEQDPAPSGSGRSGDRGTQTPAQTPAKAGAETVSEDGGQGKDGKEEKETEFKELYYYYTKISDEERLLYDAMLLLAMNYGSGVKDSETRLLETNPASDAFAESYTRAYNALIRDHPELFWIAQEKAQFECRYYLLPSLGGQYRVILSLSDASGQETFNEDGVSIYLQQQALLEKAADALLEQVDFTQSDAGIALQLHDLLIDTAWYNSDAALSASVYDYAHTAYGALVEDSSGNAGAALCDGYAMAYEYLMQRAGLSCIVVSGYAGPTEADTEKHAWNLVELDGEWYEVDATWDDLDFLLSPSEDGYELVLEALSDEDYMSRIRHYMFNRTTEEMRSFTPGDEFTYVSDNGWVALLQPSVHIRSTADESEENRDYVTPLAPTAEGTWYTWEMLTGRE